MDFEESLFSYLTGYANLSALIGDRLYPPDDVPQNVQLPYCAYTIVSRQREESMGGYAGVQQRRVQVSVFGNTYKQAKNVVEPLIVAMEAWISPEIKHVKFADETDLGKQINSIRHIAVDFLVQSA